ncbi:MAG: hypothetical protein IJ562_13120, partial [Prevotella sp.]|nr:hypothetical protein [Prevotella sp.]
KFRQKISQDDKRSMLAFRRGLRLYLGKRRLAMPLKWMRNQTRADFMSSSLESLTPDGARFPVSGV